MSDLARNAEEVLSDLANLKSVRLAVPKQAKFSRGDVVNAFASAFELIGGTTRLALWANDNPGDFYKLFGKLLPSATQVELTSRPPGDVKSYSTAELEQMLRENRSHSADVIELSEYQSHGLDIEAMYENGSE
jgi:hypothetical protein